jgi:catechol 2,3-dioxygenase-like lactoylglutathione lyase family enzyme
VGPDATAEPNVQQAVPFLFVTDLEASLRYYGDGLGFEMTKEWVREGKRRWCWLQRGGGALMLQQFWTEGPHARVPEGKLGEGVTVCFICEDALAIYREVTARGIKAARPFVGNGMWVTSLSDPDGYRIDFESPTDAPEETVYSEDEQLVDEGLVDEARERRAAKRPGISLEELKARLEL